MRYVFIVSLLVCLPISVLAQQGNWKQVKDVAASGIVRVHVIYETRQRLQPYRQGDMEFRLGTGFFIDKTHMVTNQHVIEGARMIKVEGVATKEKFTVRLAAVPSLKFDLAILEFVNAAERERFERINGPIIPLSWARWEEIQPGEEVAVLGFGKSEQLVATQGIISNWEARHDLYQRRLDHVTLMRTDAAVNTGNSGGPVISPTGRVVGISARYGAGENIGLLIPGVTAKQVVDVMIKEKKFIETDPGIITYNLNPVIREALNLAPDQVGLVVSHVIPESSADEAGLRKWDVLTAVNGYPINHGEIKHEHIGRLPYWFLFNSATPGTTITFERLREGKESTVTLTLAATTMPRIWLPNEGNDYQPEWGFLGGLVITEVTRDLLMEIEKTGNWRWDLVNDTPLDGKIYIVSTIEPGTQAMSYQEYGLDLIQLRILAIDGQPLNGELIKHLDEIYQSIRVGAAPEMISVEMEKNISIKLETNLLLADMHALHNRYPVIGRRNDTYQSAPASLHQRNAPAFYRWLVPNSFPSDLHNY